jgi:hypothetical protein
MSCGVHLVAVFFIESDSLSSYILYLSESIETGCATSTLQTAQPQSTQSKYESKT